MAGEATLDEHFNKLQWIHVDARAAHSQPTHSYSLQVNFNPFYGLELHQKTNCHENFMNMLRH